MRISDWSSDVCSSDLIAKARGPLLEMILRCRRRYGLTIGPGYLTFCDTFRDRHRVAPRSRRQPQQLRRSRPPVRTEPRGHAARGRSGLGLSAEPGYAHRSEEKTSGLQ